MYEVQGLAASSKLGGEERIIGKRYRKAMAESLAF